MSGGSFKVTLEHQRVLGRARICVKGPDGGLDLNSYVASVTPDTITLLNREGGVACSAPLKLPAEAEFRLNVNPNPLNLRFAEEDQMAFATCQTQMASAPRGVSLLKAKPGPLMLPHMKASPSLSLMAVKKALEDEIADEIREANEQAQLRDYYKEDYHPEEHNTYDLAMIVSCRRCCGNLRTLRLKRILPLPSLNWLEDSRDWFCPCSAAAGNFRKRRLPDGADALIPGSDDVFYSQSFVTLATSKVDMDGFELGGPPPSASASAGGGKGLKVVRCFRCHQVELGISDGNSLLLWSNLVEFDSAAILGLIDETSGDDYETTFRTIMDELIKEVQFLSAKILLQDCSDPTRCVKFLTLKTNTTSYQGVLSVAAATPTAAAAGHASSRAELKEVKNRVPVMWAAADRDPGDHVVFKVTPSIIDAAINYMERSTKESLPKFNRVDPVSGMTVGYLQLLER